MTVRATLRGLGPCDIAAVLLCAAILAHAVWITTGVYWPADPDQFRDLSQAQTMLNGSWMGDPYYRGETFWYNPLTGAVLATWSALAGVEPHIAHTTAGPYINLIAPIALYVFLATAVSRPAGLLGLVAFVAFDHSLTYIAASYSPWIFPATIAQGLFFTSLALLAASLRRTERPPTVLSGVLLGVVFLAHVAPAVTLGGVVAGAVFWHHGRRGAMRAVGQLLLIAVVAAVVASPFLWSIVGRYGLEVVHPHPSLWQEEMLKLEHFGTFVQDHILRWMMLPVAVGLGWAIRSFSIAGPRMVVWMATMAVIGLSYAYLWQWLGARDIAIPAVLPGFHFFRYVKLAEVVLFGVGAALLLDVGLGVLRRRLTDTSQQRLSQTAAVALSLMIVVASYPSYASRADMTSVRDYSRRVFTGEDQYALYRWIREQPDRDAIYAAPNNVSLSLIGPAGGRVLVTDPFFSNPHVDWQSRNAARNDIVRALATEDCAAVRTVARQFDVTFIVADRKTISSEAPCGVGPAFNGSEWRVFRLPQWFLQHAGG